MFGISYDTWKDICKMYFSISVNRQKGYLQWFPFSKLSKNEKKLIMGDYFFYKYIYDGGFVLFPEIMIHSENFIQKADGSFRNSKLISPILYLVLQCIGKEISTTYISARPKDIKVYYAGNYEFSRPTYHKDYHNFYNEINLMKEEYQYFIKTDITNFFDNININELVTKINDVCNTNKQNISQTQLFLIKELLLYCGDGRYPLIENSLASSYLATIIYLDEIDCELHDFISNKISGILDFQMIRYVDDLYILFSSDGKSEDLISYYNTLRSEYSSILKKHGLSLNTKKCFLGISKDINNELKKSHYDDPYKGIEEKIIELSSSSLKGFFEEIYECVKRYELTNERYTQLIDEYFSVDGIDFTASDVFNYFVYENQNALRVPEISDTIFNIIKQDISFISIDSKRLMTIVMQSRNDDAVKAVLNQLFRRYREGMWNSYDTSIAIAYLIQSKFRHIDLLKILFDNSPGLYYYYFYYCRISFSSQIHNEKKNRYLRCINRDTKATFLYFMSRCEINRFNILGYYAYYKSFFDRISADMAFLTGADKESRSPNYNKYYTKGVLKSLYSECFDSSRIIENAHNLRNENPLCHATARLIDSNSSNIDIRKSIKELDSLIDQYSKAHNL